MLVGGLHGCVDVDPAGRSDFEPGVDGQLHVGANPGRHDHQIGRKRALVGDDPRDRPVAFKRLDRRTGQDLDAVRLHVEFDQPGHLPVEQAQDLRALLDQGDAAYRS